MSILDRLRQKKQQPAQQHHSVEERAQQLISELVSDLDAPNQNIVNDLTLLISTLAKNPDPNLDMSQVMQTAQVLIHQLVKPISNPNQQLIDELLHLISASAGKGPQANIPAANQAPVTPKQPENNQAKQEIKQSLEQAQQPKTPTIPEQKVQEQAEPVKQTGDAKPQQEPATEKQQQTAPEKNEKAADEKAATPAANQAPATPKQPENMSKHMLNLIMDQTKEVVKITGTLNNKIKDLEDKTVNKMTSHEETINEVRAKLNAYDKQFEEIQKAMDKFIGLYEIITNQFNPFINSQDDDEQENTNEEPPERTKTAKKQTKQEQTDNEQPEKKEKTESDNNKQDDDVKKTIKHEEPEEKAEESATTANLPSGTGELISLLKSASASEYNTLLDGDTNLLAAWARENNKDKVTMQALENKPSKQDTIKILMKVMLKEKMKKK